MSYYIWRTFGVVTSSQWAIWLSSETKSKGTPLRVYLLFVKLKPCTCFTENGEQLFHCLFAAITKIQEATYRWLYHKNTGWLDSVAHVHGIAERKHSQHHARCNLGTHEVVCLEGRPLVMRQANELCSHTHTLAYHNYDCFIIPQ